MDIDPEYEFECPKWCDFDCEGENGEIFEGLDDSWFEKDHPLHEPKNKEKIDLKPLIDTNENQTRIKTNAPKSHKNTAKSNNSEKAVGVKKSVRLKRGDHGGTGRRKLPDTKAIITRQTSTEKTKGDQDKVNSNENKAPKEVFCQDKQFTPPWEYCSPSREVTNEDADVSPKTALLNSPLRGPLMSPPVNSPKHTLLAKAVNKASYKRRILPSIPTANQGRDNLTHLPKRGTTQSEGHSPTSLSPVLINKNCPVDGKINPPKHKSLSDMNLTEKKKNNVNEDKEMSIEDLLKIHNQKILASKSKYDSNGRRKPSVADLPAVFTEEPSDDTNHAESKDVLNEEMSCPLNLNKIASHNQNVNVEDKELSAVDMLKLHNRKIMASRSKYDPNGRRIQSANPSFCPAPTKSVVAEKPKKTVNKGRRSDIVTLTRQKRPSCSTEVDSKANLQNKKYRRSCVAAPITCTTTTVIPEEQNGCPASKSPKNNVLNTCTVKSGVKNKRRSCMAVPTTSLASAATGRGSSVTGQKPLKQKRRSCVAALQTPNKCGQTDDVDQEIKDLIAKHNQRLALHK